MLEVRYDKNTGEVTAWCGDPKSFGNLNRGWDAEAIITIDIPIPKKELGAYLFNKASQTLIDNPDYISREPRNLFNEIDKLKAEIKELRKLA